MPVATLFSRYLLKESGAIPNTAGEQPLNQPVVTYLGVRIPCASMIYLIQFQKERLFRQLFDLAAKCQVFSVNRASHALSCTAFLENSGSLERLREYI